MKRILLTLLTVLCALAVEAQTEVTRFLDIPVDGTKTEMLRKLKAKGFKPNAYNAEILEGQFNGADVRVFVGAYRDKVYRVMVAEEIGRDEAQARIRYNNLYLQFANNDKYVPVSAESYVIPEGEDIRYEMLAHKKSYQAAYMQKGATASTSPAGTALDAVLSYMSRLVTLTDEQKGEVERNLDRMTDEQRDELLSRLPATTPRSEAGHDAGLENRMVWFALNENHGKYTILIYYDNMLNMARGDEL